MDDHFRWKGSEKFRFTDSSVVQWAPPWAAVPEYAAGVCQRLNPGESCTRKAAMQATSPYCHNPHLRRGVASRATAPAISTANLVQGEQLPSRFPVPITHENRPSSNFIGCRPDRLQRLFRWRAILADFRKMVAIAASRLTIPWRERTMAVLNWPRRRWIVADSKRVHPAGFVTILEREVNAVWQKRFAHPRG